MKKKALVVDDEKAIRDIMRELLEVDFEIQEALNGQEALEKYALWQPDLVIMDIEMPKMSGVESSKRMLQIDHQAKIIVVSGQDNDWIEEELFSLGICSYHLKPFDLTLFLADVDKILQHQEIKAVVHY